MGNHKERVLALFEKHRASPGAPYDANHFLDFLLPAPAKDRTVYNSFSGLRRFNAFLDELQFEFAVCFSFKDRDANYSLDRFVARVQELQQSRRSSLASLKYQSTIPVEGFVVVINLILLVTALASKNNVWVLAAAITGLLAFNVWYYRFRRKAMQYLQSLRARIEGGKQNAV